MTFYANWTRPSDRLPADTKTHTKMGVSKIGTYLRKMTEQSALSVLRIYRFDFIIQTKII